MTRAAAQNDGKKAGNVSAISRFLASITLRSERAARRQLGGVTKQVRQRESEGRADKGKDSESWRGFGADPV